jgi:hypothetical protein
MHKPPPPPPPSCHDVPAESGLRKAVIGVENTVDIAVHKPAFAEVCLVTLPGL